MSYSHAGQVKLRFAEPKWLANTAYTPHYAAALMISRLNAVRTAAPEKEARSIPQPRKSHRITETLSYQ